MSRTTRTIALLWRDWKRGEGWFIDAGSVFAFLVAVAIAFLIGAYALGGLMDWVLPHLGAPRIFAGLITMFWATIGWLLFWCIRDTYRALRSAWERAGREEP